MVMISRRMSLGLLAGAVVPPTVVVGAAPMVAAATKMTAQERYDYHLAEFQAAAEELDPMIGYWHLAGAENPQDGNRAIGVYAFHITGRYEGDGRYEGGSPRFDGTSTIYNVKLMDYRIDDERVFHVSTSMDRLLLTETRFNTFIRQRVGDLL